MVALTPPPSPSNVIALPQRAVQGGPLAQVLRYWEHLREDAALPRQADLRPHDLAPVLDHVFTGQRIAPTHARLRSAGQQLTTLMGMEVRGMPLMALFAPESRHDAGRALESCLDRPAVVELALVGEAGLFRTPLSGRMLLLPLLDEAGAIAQVLGALEIEGKSGRKPQRLQIKEVTVRALTSAGTPAQAERHTPAPRKAPAPAPMPRAGSGLRLVCDNTREPL